MKRMIFLGVLAAVPYSMASSLAVYQDKTLYTYLPQNTYIGLTQNIKATCDTERVSTVTLLSCPDKERLCGLYSKALELGTAIRRNSANSKVLEQLISLPQPNTVDADSWISAAKKISEEETRLAEEKEKLSNESKRVKQAFEKQTRSAFPLGLENRCDGKLELSLPYGYVTFSTQYEATLHEKEISVSQKLSIVNHSGIDIRADEAHFYYRSAQQYIRPVHFSPWIVKERKNYVPKKVKRTLQKMSADEEIMQLSAVAADSPAPMRATYEDAREYTVKALELPSIGEPKSVPVMEWKVPVTCRTELFAYRNPYAFEVCSFKPEFQIEQNRWKIKSGEKIINENAIGEYEKGTYRIYTHQDQDIKVVRKKIVQKERETGIFGGTARKKDGFTLTLTNKSDKEKQIVVTERIPTSTKEKIKVKLLSVKGSKPLKYQLSKEGKLKMDVTLLPYESEKIEVLFEISYDKDLKIDY